MKQHAEFCEFAGQDWEMLADSMDGYSGSDIMAVTLGALFEPLRDMQLARHWLYDPQGKNKHPLFKITLLNSQI